MKGRCVVDRMFPAIQQTTRVQHDNQDRRVIREVLGETVKHFVTVQQGSTDTSALRYYIWVRERMDTKCAGFK